MLAKGKIKVSDVIVIGAGPAGVLAEILSVHYEELAPILLSEIQHQKNQLVAQTAHAAAQDAQIRELKKMLAEIQAGLVRLQTKDTLVAQR
jgi:threonine dehydrogenase-like Zn-dependent dehydrogenase